MAEREKLDAFANSSIGWLIFFLVFFAVVSGIYVYFRTDSSYISNWLKLYFQILGIYFVGGVVVYFMNSYTNLFLILFYSIVIGALLIVWVWQSKNR